MVKYFKSIAVLVLFPACAFAQTGKFQKEYINPGPGYANVVAITSGTIKTIHVSGQTGEGNDLEAQIKSAFDNLEKQLKDAGADLSDIVKMTTYIVKYKESDLDVFRKVRGEVLGKNDYPANTLLGVYSLYKDQYLVELEAVAMIEVED